MIKRMRVIHGVSRYEAWTKRHGTKSFTTKLRFLYHVKGCTCDLCTGARSWVSTKAYLRWSAGAPQDDWLEASQDPNRVELQDDGPDDTPS